MNAIALPVSNVICHLSQTHAEKSRGTQAGSQKHTDTEIVFPQGKKKVQCEIVS
jgi:hypothetical protein